jgi:dTDP-4-amino-4,6-dideoxygalactose transaminase
MELPLIRPNPPKLSQMQAELEALEASGVFTNNGPRVRRFESDLVERLFAGEGAALAVSNATVGLMIAIRQAMGRDKGEGRFALMPSFTFAATAHAAIWAGLTPLLCDIDPGSWTSDGPQEEALLARYGNRIAAIVPYAAFGRSLDLDRYHWLSKRYAVPVVIDAASSLGTVDRDHRNFGTGSDLVFVYSMHATKTFSTAEGGVVYSGDTAKIEQLRVMTNYGFEQGRSASLPGMNAKLSEVGALMALAKLAEIDRIADHRATLAAQYRSRLPDYEVQDDADFRQAMQFMSILLPPALAEYRAQVIAQMAESGIGAGAYFSPHLAQQAYFQAESEFGSLPVSDDIGARILTLPITDMMSIGDVDRVCIQFRAVCAAIMHPINRRIRSRPIRTAAQ